MDGERIRTVGRWVLGAFLVVAGTGHLTAQRVEFRAQVPPWLPVDADLVVLVSGVVEIALGLALVLAGRRSPWVGVVVAGFFVAIFPGNVAQFVEQRDAFGLDSDLARFVRLWFQPLLVVWALWSTGGWRWWRARRAGTPAPASPAATAATTVEAPGPVDLEVGGRVSLVLRSNPSTGYSWDLTSAPDTSVVRVVSDTYVAPAQQVPGAGGTQEILLEGVSPGTTALVFSYRRPWETGVPPADTAAFDVTVAP